MQKLFFAALLGTSIIHATESTTIYTTLQHYEAKAHSKQQDWSTIINHSLVIPSNKTEQHILDSALLRASRSNHLATAQWLLGCGASTTRKTSSGKTALFFAKTPEMNSLLTTPRKTESKS